LVVKNKRDFVIVVSNQNQINYFDNALNGFNIIYISLENFTNKCLSSPINKLYKIPKTDSFKSNFKREVNKHLNQFYQTIFMYPPVVLFNTISYPTGVELYILKFFSKKKSKIVFLQHSINDLVEIKNILRTYSNSLLINIFFYLLARKNRIISNIKFVIRSRFSDYLFLVFSPKLEKMLKQNFLFGINIKIIDNIYLSNSINWSNVRENSKELNKFHTIYLFTDGYYRYFDDTSHIKVIIQKIRVLNPTAKLVIKTKEDELHKLTAIKTLFDNTSFTDKIELNNSDDTGFIFSNGSIVGIELISKGFTNLFYYESFMPLQYDMSSQKIIYHLLQIPYYSDIKLRPKKKYLKQSDINRIKSIIGTSNNNLISILLNQDLDPK
jgi:hypothetical protein